MMLTRYRPAFFGRTVVLKRPPRTSMRLRWTVAQRPPTWRSRRHCTRCWLGASVPLIENALPALARRLSLVSDMLGAALIVTGPDSSRPRVASPANTARTCPEAGIWTLVAQLPSFPQLVGGIWVHAEPAAVYSTPSVAPAAEEPSAKRRMPDTLVGLA